VYGKKKRKEKEKPTIQTNTTNPYVWVLNVEREG
jgi:hypothetical protein